MSAASSAASFYPNDALLLNANSPSLKHHRGGIDPYKEPAFFYTLAIFAILLGLVTTYCRLRRKMPEYSSTKEAIPGAVLVVDTLDLERISRGLGDGVFTSEDLVIVWIAYYCKVV